jgi:hypothetical protein
MTVLYIILAVAVVLFAVVAMQPAAFTVSRSARITAPPEIVFEQVNDLHRWQDWSPWSKMDPNAKITYEGSASGTGAGYSWQGNAKVGAGRMAITDSRPFQSIDLRLEMLKPMRATNQVKFTFAPVGNQTEVTWSMSGRKNFMAKAFGLIVDCDKMCGSQFEKGLSGLKSVTEQPVAVR